MESHRKFYLIDGGLATELVNTYGHANIQGDPLWSSRLIASHPNDIAAVHQSYLDVGCDVAETATYQASLEGLQKHLSVDATAAVDIIHRGVKICLKARDDFWQKAKKNYDDKKPIVAGSIGPYGAFLADGSEYNGHYVDKLSLQELVNWHRPQVDAIWQSGVDMLAFETIPAQKEAEAIVALLKEFPDAKAWITFSCRDGNSTCHGEYLGDAMKSLSVSNQIFGYGINCTAPWFIDSLLDSIPLAIKTTKSIVVYPNNGQFWLENKKWSDADVCNSRNLSDYVDGWIEKGAKWIGGCCQVTPKDIAPIRKVIDKHINNNGTTKGID